MIPHANHLPGERSGCAVFISLRVTDAGTDRLSPAVATTAAALVVFAGSEFVSRECPQLLQNEAPPPAPLLHSGQNTCLPKPC